MQASSIPSKIQLPFANSGVKNTIPVASQIGITAGAASFTDGFPPLTFTPISAGGVPPAGGDFNGILNAITAVQQWQSAGGIFKWDSAFATAIGGYPAGAILQSSAETISWLNLVDNNSTNPDATDGSAANWAPLGAYGIGAVTGLTNANVTLLPSQFGYPVITLSGALTANVQIIFPTLKSRWIVVNNTTGAYTVTCKTASGTGATVTQGALQEFWGDGTNLNAYGFLSQGQANTLYALINGSSSQAFLTQNATPNTQQAMPIAQWEGFTAFSAYQSTGQAISAGTNTLLNFQTKNFDIASEFSTSTNLFTAANAGIYEFGVQVLGTQNTVAASWSLDLVVNGATSSPDRIDSNGYPISALNGLFMRKGSRILQLSSGDTVGVYYDTNVADTLDATGNTIFWGKRLG